MPDPAALTLAFDTETTGLPLWHEPSDHPGQPHLVQFAGLVLDADGNEIDKLSTLVKPGPGAVMAPEALAAHGISLERAMDEGAAAIDVLIWFRAIAARAARLVGHNVQFDVRIMRIAAARATGVKWQPACPQFCTLKRSQDIVGLPPTQKMMAAGRFGPKPPNLGECYRYFFGEELAGAHDALVDVRASARIFLHLTQKLGMAA